MAGRARDIKRPSYWHWYHTSTWRGLRREVLRTQPNCVFCLEKGIYAEATIVDHVIAHKGQWRMFANLNNLQGLCASCHSGTKRRIERMHSRVDRQMQDYQTDRNGWIVRRRASR